MFEPVVDIGPGIAQDQCTRTKGSIFLPAILFCSIDACQVTTCRKADKGIVFWKDIEFFGMLGNIFYQSVEIMHGCVRATCKAGSVFQNESCIS